LSQIFGGAEFPLKRDWSSLSSSREFRLRHQRKGNEDPYDESLRRKKEMTAKQLQKYIGKRGKLRLTRFNFDVKVIDARYVNKRLELLVSLTAGRGEFWVRPNHLGLGEPMNSSDLN